MIAAALITTNGPDERLDRRWIARATDSLPEPEGPEIITRLFVGATLSMSWRRWFIAADRRMRPDLAPDTTIWVDKMPENYRLIGFLLTAYPNARIVNLIRDPRDVALSMWRAHFSGTALNYTYDLRAMAHRFNLYARAMAHWRRVFPGAILDLAYEDLVQDVDTASRRLAAFCGLDRHPAMLRPDLAAGQILTHSAGQLRQPVHARSIGGWRRHADELAPFIAGLDPALWPQVR